jgi:uncharacterized membrane-anchored protein YitT (DUF2179 family)
MITYLSASKTLDFIIDGIEEYMGVTIITTKNQEVKTVIIATLGHGVTTYKGESGFGKQGETNNIEIIYTVVTRLELNRLKAEITKIDENAFVIISSVKDAKGGIIPKRGLKY